MKDQNSKKAANSNPVMDIYLPFLQMIPENKEFLFHFLDSFPLPVEVFDPEGNDVFSNRAFLELNNIPDVSLVIGNYNILKDTVINDQMGMRSCIEMAFRGEAVSVYDVIAPIQDLVDRGITVGKPFEKSFMDFHLFPVMDGKKLLFVVFICNIKKLYYGRPDLAKAKEYMDTHWQEEYNAEEVAKFVNMSVSQLYNIFKKHTGMPPGEYFRIVKIEHLKEKLADNNLSIKEAFAACGVDSRGAFAGVFKKITGFSPSEYRKRNTI